MAFFDKTNLFEANRETAITKLQKSLKDPKTTEQKQQSHAAEKAHFSHFSRNFEQYVSDQQVHAVCFSPNDGQMLATSTEDGDVQISCANSGTPLYSFASDPEGVKNGETRLPVTQLKWRPTQSDNLYDQVLVGACLDGSIVRWTANQSNTAEKHMLNPLNSYHSVDFSIDGKRFGVAGQQTQIEFYDLESLKKFQVLDFNKNKCHANKIFSARFSPLNPNQLYSGGWDCNVKLWDLRHGQVTHNICGVQVCGDSLDMDQDGKTLVTGGGSSGEGLQVWDIRHLKKPSIKCEWNPYSQVVEPTINAARIMHGQGIVVAGCSDEGAPCKAFSLKNGGQIVHEYPHLAKGCFAIDIARDGSQMVLTDNKGKIKVEHCNYIYLKEGQEKEALSGFQLI